MKYLIRFGDGMYSSGGISAVPIERALRFDRREDAIALCERLYDGVVIEDAPLSEIRAAVIAERERCIAACRKVAASGMPYVAAVEACIAEIQKGGGR